MVSVTQRVKTMKQPRGGYIPHSKMNVVQLSSEVVLYPMEEENISPAIVGTVVDYMTRFMVTNDVQEAFRISLFGVINAKQKVYGANLALKITGLDDESIINACKLAGFDVAYRVGPGFYKPVGEANEQTISNIKEMVRRSLLFFESYGPVIKDGFTFEGAYNNTISTGDGDFLTEDTLWDFKVSKHPPKKEHTLQLLIYYFMGKRSVHNEFNNITEIGIFNPRLHSIYTYDVSNLEQKHVDEIKQKVMGYIE